MGTTRKGTHSCQLLRFSHCERWMRVCETHRLVTIIQNDSTLIYVKIFTSSFGLDDPENMRVLQMPPNP
jgi:hypothetical protein